IAPCPAAPPRRSPAASGRFAAGPAVGRRAVGMEEPSTRLGCAECGGGGPAWAPRILVRHVWWSTTWRLLRSGPACGELAAPLQLAFQGRLRAVEDGADVGPSADVGEGMVDLSLELDVPDARGPVPGMLLAVGGEQLGVCHRLLRGE